ncbi:general stress protein 26 [Hydrogenophaga palleronii]|uniref:General stress protein 26 n=1 Tax=Hydrogenophaga palleronii TaxID=65655 RepID=A0ABU1WID6_9BURK|nr:pyridoxamine 5'-phosphate oxidase family protein [Hydrogenophaga palleronii]MDR7148816.1 general stress protein 26 [Hydrogenophaga palleronii]
MTSTTKSPSDLWKMIKDIKFGMFTTKHHGGEHTGHLHSRPMTTQNNNFDDGKLWFFMSRSSGPVEDLVADPIINVSYAEPDDDTYVSVSGTAKLVNDVEQARALWSKAADAWFSGPEDPDLALVAVTVQHAHYWDVKENKLTQLLVMAKAAITGKEPELGESGETSLRGS